MINFAYIDKGGILHVTGNKKTAEEYCKFGKVVETGIACGGGYPVATYHGKEEEIIVYNETDMRLDAHGEKVIFPHLAALYTECRG